MSERRPKLIATDLDGTIVPHNEGISHRTIAAFTKARDLGVEIFFVTGRPPRWMGDIREAFDLETLSVVTVGCYMTCIMTKYSKSG